MTNELEPITIGDTDMDGDVNTAPKVGGATSKYTKLIYIPSAEKGSITGKILKDPRVRNGVKGNAYFPIYYHEFRIGPDPIRDIRMFYSPKNVGEADKLVDEFWEAAKARKNYKSDMNSKEYKMYSSIMAATKPKEGALIYWINKGSDAVEILFVKEQMRDAIFGCGAKFDKAPVLGVIKEMNEMGLNPFNLKDNSGWVRLYKSGMGKSTTFHADIDMTKQEVMLPNGKKTFVQAPVECPVNESILRLTLDKLPDFVAVNREQSWTQEEIQAYIDSDYSIFPERYKRKDGNAAAPVVEESSDLVIAFDSTEETKAGLDFNKLREKKAVTTTVKNSNNKATEEDIPW